MNVASPSDWTGERHERKRNVVSTLRRDDNDSQREKTAARFKDLSESQRRSHGTYWYSLHAVLVHRARWTEVGEHALQRRKGRGGRNSGCEHRSTLASSVVTRSVECDRSQGHGGACLRRAMFTTRERTPKPFPLFPSLPGQVRTGWVDRANHWSKRSIKYSVEFLYIG